ncbi:uncharacterized protein LOC114630272 [Grammomys surdaster]|uniref:uncharacterized protein LOC114630272 n=1 Tax=Grammomys surdaster TaxID=491861 RepID=UPI00109F1F76|nr:uncharacterized protein LOC114630272 [Grammomys surdaster]XP_028634229.1 uncharacterized protein LOC114630272 [Grammomys surdaster]XP_028634230.1 uncharacterized protein LOC114630272 [Grammomys surdaster]XP_028634231.1 uncharacterized protein LOC114630272 [Grammomys surdaster]
MLSLTELSQKSAELAEMRSGPLGRCSHFFWLGVAFDAVGVAVLFTGVFSNLLFYDMLLYLGSIIIFVSLLWWISWYTGNIEALPEDLLRETSPREGGVHRSGSRRFSLTLRRVSNTFQRIRRRRRRRRLHPRVDQRISSISSTDPGQLGRNRKPESAVNQFGGVQASKSLPLVHIFPPLSICTSRSQPVFSVTSQSYPLASDSNSRMALSSDSHMPVDSHPYQRSNISVASQSYPLERTESQSHLLVPVSSDNFSMISQSHLQSSDSYVSVPVDHHSEERSKISVASRSYPLDRAESQSHLFVISDSLSMVPVTSQSQIQPSVSSESRVPVDLTHSQGCSKISVASQIYPLERAESQSHLLVPVPSDSFPMSLAQQSHLQNLPPASQAPETGKASKSHTLAKGVPVLPPGVAQTQHPQASLAQTSQSISSPVQKVPKN